MFSFIFIYIYICCVHIVNLFILQIVLYILLIFGQVVQSIKSRFVVQFAKKKNEIVHFMKIIYFKIVRIIKQYNYSLQVLINVLFISQTRLNN